MDYIDHVDGLCQSEEVRCVTVSPLELLQNAGTRTQGQIAFYFLVAGSTTLGALIIIPLLGYWWLYPLLGILVPVLLNCARATLIDFWATRIGEGFEECMREYGNFENVLRALKMQSHIMEKLGVVFISLWLTEISPVLCLALFSVLGVPFGLKLVSTAPLLEVNYFILVGGLVPGALLLQIAIRLSMFLRRAEIHDADEQVANSFEPAKTA